MSQIRVKVRGIYATALTLLLSQKFQIVEPSDVIQARLGIPASFEPADVNVFDRADRHGIVIEGVRSAAEEVAEFLRETIPWAVFCQAEVRKKSDSPLALAAGLLSRFEAEFPKPAKDFLDSVRAKVVPTMPDHHLLKTVDATKVDEVEAKVPAEELAAVAQNLWEEMLASHYLPGTTVALWHLKAGESPIQQSGVVVERTRERLLLRRNFKAGGLYDGLGVPKEAGDYGLVELYPERWWGRRLYFRADGTLIGELYNIQTPPEFLPTGVRYLDLEVDIAVAGGEVRVLDREILEKKVAEKVIPEALAQKAWEETQRLLNFLSAKRM